MWHDNDLYALKGLFGKSLDPIDLKTHNIYLGLTSQPLISLKDLNLQQSHIDPNMIIIASRHSSKTARPAFLVHTTGNWGLDTSFGGDPRSLSLTSALLHKAGFLSLSKVAVENKVKEFSVDIEVTHHGPTSLTKPLIFMELGSSNKHWINKEGGMVVSKSIINTISEYLKLKDMNRSCALGFGGTHYGPNFSRLILNTQVAMSFICPKYHVKDLDFKMVNMMIKNTYEKIDYFIIDWKGTNSEEKNHLMMLLAQFDIPIKKTKDFN
jgi:D-aminoacyl-tRNA deacylase